MEKIFENINSLVVKRIKSDVITSWNDTTNGCNFQCVWQFNPTSMEWFVKELLVELFEGKFFAYLNMDSSSTVYYRGNQTISQYDGEYASQLSRLNTALDEFWSKTYDTIYETILPPPSKMMVGKDDNKGDIPKIQYNK